MQRADQIINQTVGLTRTTQAGLTRSSTTQATDSDRQWTANAVNRVIHQLKAIFPAWTAALKTPELEAEARRQWLQGLLEAGINTDRQIHAGLARCRSHSSPFLPSVGQFVDWCRQAGEEASGMPVESMARSALNQELGKPAQHRNWARHHPAVYWAYTQRSTFDWKSCKDADQQKMFSDVWSEARKMARDGFDFRAVLPAPERGADSGPSEPASPEVAQKHCSEILSMFPAAEEEADD